MKIHPDVRIGHVHLTVGDLARSLTFYRDLLGFEVVSRYGDSAVFLSAGGYHHHIALNTWAGRGALPAPEGYSGLYHVAILYPTRTELANTALRLIEAEYQFEGFADHLVSEALYLRDPDNNGIELYVDRPRDTWEYDENGLINMETKPLNIESLLAEATGTTQHLKTPLPFPAHLSNSDE